MKMNIFKRFDVLCTLLLIIAAVIMIIIFNINKDFDVNAVITKNGQQIYKINLNKVNQSYILNLEDEYNISLFIEHDGVAFIHSDCNDKICVNTGKISKNAQVAVCLPAKVAVKIEADNNFDDAFTG